MRSALLAACVAVCAASAAFAQVPALAPATASRPAAQAPALPVGFVDVQQVFAQYKKASELQDQLKKDFDQMMTAQRREKEKITAMKDASEGMFVEGSKEWLDQLKKIRLAEIELELNQRTIAFGIEDKWAEVLRKVYADVKREVKAVAEEKGYKLVLMIQSTEVTAKKRDDVMNNILVRPVLYFDPSSDLTGETLARLNK
jgi:Skp family chaperone for outer membrane proteins